MEPQERQRIIDRYNERLVLYGDDIRSLASGTPERRRIRYQVLSDIGIGDGASVLDLGCGFGDLSAFFAERGLAVDYSGCDINPSLIDIAKVKYPGGSFFVGDIQADDMPAQYDFVVSSSAFNNRLVATDQYEHIASIMRRAYAISNVGVAIDFLSNYVDYESPEAFHYDPEKIFKIAKQISKRVCLRHDYPLFEFCIYIYKDFEGWASGK